MKALRNPSLTMKTTLATLGLALLTVPVWAATGSGGAASNDTLIFSLLAGIAVVQLILIIVVAGIINRVVTSRQLWFKNDDNSSDSGSGIGGKLTAIALMLGFSLMSGDALAADGDAGEPLIYMTNGLFWWMIIGNLVLFGFLMILVNILQGLIKTASGVDENTEPGWLDSLSHSLTDVVAIEDEEQITFDHEYDGIRELDNNLPPWWVAMFYGTIAFAIFYIGYYHISDAGLSQEEEYLAAMAEAQAEKDQFLASAANLVDESNVTLLTDASVLESGKTTFVGFCAACHGQVGEGNNGPNLTDEYWLHGGGIQNVFSTIKYGVPAKGMQSWQKQLSPDKIQAVASYILVELQGSNPANPKDPEGELWVEPEVEEPAIDSTATEVPADSAMAAMPDTTAAE